MSVVIVCRGLSGYRVGGGGAPVGLYLRSYDPEGNGGYGDHDWTPDAADALVFSGAAEAHALWTAVPQCRPIRADGRPNRPLTALTIEIVPL